DGGSEAAVADIDFGMDYAEIYISHRVELPTCWTGNGSGHKWFYVIPRNETSWGSGMWTSQEPSNSLRVIDGVDQVPIDVASGYAERNQVIHVELHMIAESAPGAGDGKIYAYKNGALVDSNTGAQWFSDSNGSYALGFGKLHYYMRANAGPPDCHIWVHELYVSGKAPSS